MKKILIVVGHDFENKGAHNEYFDMSEYDIVKQIGAKIFMNEKSKRFDTILKARNKYKELPNEINSLEPDLVVCLHLNAFNKQAQGTETLYWNTSKKGKEYAKLFQKNLVDKLKYPDRGIKAIDNSERGALILNQTNAPCILLEPFFMDSIEHYSEIAKNIEFVSETVLTTLYEIFGR